jgi:hypothetical protein
MHVGPTSTIFHTRTHVGGHGGKASTVAAALSAPHRSAAAAAIANEAPVDERDGILRNSIGRRRNLEITRNLSVNPPAKAAD